MLEGPGSWDWHSGICGHRDNQHVIRAVVIQAPVCPTLRCLCCSVAALVDPYRTAAGSHGNRCCSGYTEGHSHMADHDWTSHHSDPDRTELRRAHRSWWYRQPHTDESVNRTVSRLTCGAGTFKVLAALIMWQAAEVTGTLLSSGVYLTTTTNTAALGFQIIYKPQWGIIGDLKYIKNISKVKSTCPTWSSSSRGHSKTKQEQPHLHPHLCSCATQRASDSVVIFSACVSSPVLQAVGLKMGDKGTETFKSQYTHSHYTPTLLKCCQDVINRPTLVINELLHTVSPFRTREGNT